MVHTPAIRDMIDAVQDLSTKVRVLFPEVQVEQRVYWYSHAIISDFLREMAGDDPEKIRVAIFVKNNTHLCWRQFLMLDDPMKEWALGVLALRVRKGDSAPVELRILANQLATEKVIIRLRGKR